MIKSCRFIPLSVLRVVFLYQAQLITRSEVCDFSDKFQLIHREFHLIHNLEWHLVKKKISNRIDVERPDEDILLRYRENSHEPLPNYAEDHILNTVRANLYFHS
jgi:hypothetical protein